MGKPSLNNIRFKALVFSALLVMALLYGYLSYHHAFTGVISDSMIYLLMADYFSPINSLDSTLFKFILENYPYPPLYPLLLGAVGGGSSAPVNSYFLNVILLVVVLWLGFVWCARLLESRKLAGFVMLIFAILPTTLLHSMMIVSEHLYLLLTLAGFLLLLKSERSPALLIAAGLLFGLSALSRTVGVVAITAFIYTVIRREKTEYRLISVFFSVVPLILWVGIKQFTVSGDGYLSSLYQAFEGDLLSNLLSQVHVNLQLLWLYWVKSFDFNLSPHARIIAALILLPALSGLVMRLRGQQADALYIAAYLGVLIVWPFPDQMERFIYVVMPFLLSYGVLGIIGPVARLQSKVALRSLVVLYFMVIGLLIAPSLSQIYSRITHPAGEGMWNAVRSPSWVLHGNPWEARKNAELLDRVNQSIRQVGELVPESACVSAISPTFVLFYARRKSVRPSHPDLGRAHFYTTLSSCDYVYMMAVKTLPDLGFGMMYPFHRIKHNMSVLAVSYFDPDDTSGPVLTMLSRYLPASPSP